MAASPAGPALTPCDHDTTATPTTPFPFLRLPLELREAIYSLYFKPADRLRQSASLEAQGFFGGLYAFEFALTLVSQQVAREARAVWRRENVCVKIGTPWPSAVNHISSEGLVPIVCTDARADSFSGHHASVHISAPFHDAAPEHTIVLLLDDLHLFAQTWYYSALAYPMLNDRLATTFALRDPDMDDIDEGEACTTVPLALQRKLLLPFGQVKGLYSLHIQGYDPAVTRELHAAIAVPVPTLQSAVESAASFMSAGDAVLRTAPTEALQLYIKAFHAIHILISGRSRRVLADTFFHAVIPRGRYAGQTGMTVRVVQRLQLVARVVLAYLHAGEWGEAAFWGMRSARIMSEAMDTEFEDFLAEIVGANEVALIYTRTGIALGRMRADKGVWADELAQYEGEALAVPGVLFAGGRKHCRASVDGVRRELEEWGVSKEGIRAFETAGREEGGRGVDLTGHVGAVGWDM